MTMRARTKVSIFDTPPELFDELARVLPAQEREKTRWITLSTSDGVEITFYAADDPEPTIEDAPLSALGITEGSE